MADDVETRLAAIEKNQRHLATLVVSAMLPIRPPQCRCFRIAIWKTGDLGSDSIAGFGVACDEHKQEGMIPLYVDERGTEAVRAVNALADADR